MHWIIGDIHGMLRPLEALLREIPRRDPGARFIFVGDYVNRGPDSPKVIDRLLKLPHATFLRGNHDDIFDLILTGQCYICHQDVPDPLSGFAWFMQHGLVETLMAYGADWAQLEHLLHHPDEKRLEQLTAIVPPSHRQFIHSLHAVSEHEDFFVAHAFWDVDEPDRSPDLSARLAADPKMRYQLLWNRFTERQIASVKRWERTGFFGHTPISNYRRESPHEPLFGPKVVLLDTAVALNVEGRLTAVCAETREVVQADRAGGILAVL